MSGFIYLWFDRKHKRYYLGSHWGTEKDGYICSSFWMKRSKKNRPEDFRRRILVRSLESREALLLEEQRWMNMMKDEELKGVRYYNLVKKVGHWHAQGDKKLKTVSEKISAGTKKAFQNPETQARLKASHICPKRNKKISEALKEMYAKRKAETGSAMTPKMLEAVSRSGAQRSKHRAKKWLVTDPQGIVHEVTSLLAWCQERGIEKCVMNLRGRGRALGYTATRA